jgi:hypothetical protein
MQWEILVAEILAGAGLLIAAYAQRNLRRVEPAEFGLVHRAELTRVHRELSAACSCFVASLLLVVYAHQGVPLLPQPVPATIAAVSQPPPVAAAIPVQAAPVPAQAAAPASAKERSGWATVRLDGPGSLRVRSRPAGAIAATLQDGEAVRLVDAPVATENGQQWRLVASPTGVSGWVDARYLAPRATDI